MRKSFLLGVSILVLLFSSQIMAAGDVAAGKTKSAACNGCHGMNGKSTNPQYPNLAGQKKLYLAKAIKAYKDGGRKDPMMSTFVATLTDQDIDDLAAFYASVK